MSLKKEEFSDNVSVLPEVSDDTNLSSDIEKSDQLKKDEEKLIHKFDRRLMPIFCLGYFFSALDRSNIGNAAVAGLETSLNLTSVQYSNAVSVVYATYLPAMLPGVWLMRKCKKPGYYMGGMMIAWSLVSIFTIFCKNYAGLIVVRILLGLFEGSYFTCMTILAADYYLPTENARRSTYYWVASAFSSSFSGLISTGCTKITSGSLKPWQYMYIIEGLLSVMAGVWLFFGLPDNPSQLIHTDTEKRVFASRTIRRKNYEGSTSFDWKELRSCFDFKLGASVVTQYCQDTCLYGFSTFLPSILKRDLGYDSMKSQYLTVPVYLWAGFLYFVAAWISDKKKARGPVIVFCNFFGIAGYILLLTVKNPGVLYFACYLISFSTYIGTGLNESWIVSNTAPAFKRATSTAINQTLGNVSGAISPQLYRKPPKYVLGNSFTLGALCLASITCTLCTLYLHRKNVQHKRILETGVDDRKQERKHGDDSPEFEFLI